MPSAGSATIASHRIALTDAPATGVAGNVGAIFVSRISTALHGAKEERYLLTAGTLFGISSPILIAFLGFVWLTGQMRIGFAFGLSYILLSFGIVSFCRRAASGTARPASVN